MLPISKENFVVVEKDQDLQQVVELKLEKNTFERFDEKVKKLEDWVDCG